MMSKLHVRLQVQFPYVKVLVLGVLVSLLGIGEVIIGVLAFTHKIWGHYLGTGLWGGIVIFMAGVCAVIASQLRGPGCAKLYFATSVVGVLVSFVMLILSSGGLDYDSNFYNFGLFDPHKHLKQHNSTIMVHGVALGFSVCSFLANIASVIICFKYVVFEKKMKYTTERTFRKTTNSLERSMLRGGTIDSRSSTSSRTPLADRSSRRSSRGRSDSEQGGSRQRTEAEEFLPNGSRTDSSRRNKDRRHKRSEERRDRGSKGSEEKRDRGSKGSEERRDRGSKGKRERNQVRQNEIPVSVQIERTAVQDDREQICNDLLPTDFDEEELPPYEEAVRYSPLTNINNQVLVNNAHNESMRSNIGDQIDVCDINDEKIYQNVHYCNFDDCERSNESLPIIEAQMPVGRASCENNAPSGNNRVAGHDKMNPNSLQRKSHSTTKHTQESSQVGNQGCDIYINQDVIASNTRKAPKRGHQSVSPSTLNNPPRRIQEARRCASAVSSVSLPVGMAPPKPPRISSSSSENCDAVETSKSDTSLNLKRPQMGFRGKPSLNDNYLGKNKQTVNIHKLSGPKLNVINNEGSTVEENGRGKNSRYKADYIQLQIRQEPEGSSSVSQNEGASTFIMSRHDNTFGSVMAHSSPRESPVSKTDQGLPLFESNGETLEDSFSENLVNSEDKRSSDSNPPRTKNTKQDNVTGTDYSSGSPNWDLSGFSPVRFASPTSAFKPYKKDSAPNSRVTSPDSVDCPISADSNGASRPGTLQRQCSWKEVMLPVSHNKTNENDSSSDSKGVPISKPTPKEVFMNTFPKPTPPIFRPPYSVKTGSNSSSMGTSNNGMSGLGGFPSLFMNKPSNVSTASNISPFQQSTLTSSVSKTSDKCLSSSSESSAQVLDASSSVPSTAGSDPSNRNVFLSSGLASAGRYNTLPHAAIRPIQAGSSWTDSYQSASGVSASAELPETRLESEQGNRSSFSVLGGLEGSAFAASVRVSQAHVRHSPALDQQVSRTVAGWNPTPQPLPQFVENVQHPNQNDQQGNLQQRELHPRQQQEHPQQQVQEEQQQGHQEQARNEPQEQPNQPPLQQRQGKPLFSIIL